MIFGASGDDRGVVSVMGIGFIRVGLIGGKGYKCKRERYLVVQGD